MRPSIALQRPRDRIREIALSHRVTNVRVFGSVFSGEDTWESDLDILVDPTRDTTLFDIAGIQVDLSNLLQVDVDVPTPNALPEKFRQRVLDEARAL